MVRFVTVPPTNTEEEYMQHVKKERSVKEWIMPTIEDQLSAKKVARNGVWAAAFCAAATILVVGLNAAGADILALDHWALVDAALFIAIAVGIHRMSRTAAVAGLLLYLLERVYMIENLGNPGTIIQVLVLTLMFISSVRATFLYHRLTRTVPVPPRAANPPSVPPIQKIICVKCGSDKIYKNQQCLNCGELITV